MIPTNDTLNLAINNPTYFHFVYYLSSPPRIGGWGGGGGLDPSL